MVKSNTNPLFGKTFSGVKFAKVKNQYDRVSVLLGTEEVICGDTYMTTLVDNKRVVKFKKSALDFA